MNCFLHVAINRDGQWIGDATTAEQHHYIVDRPQIHVRHFRSRIDDVISRWSVQQWPEDRRR